MIAILSPMIPGFNPMQMDIPRMKDQGAQNAMNMKILMAALKPAANDPTDPNNGFVANVNGGGIIPGGGAAPGGMVNQTGGIAGLLNGAGAGGGAMGMLGKLLQKKPPLDPNAAVDPLTAGGLDAGAAGGVGGLLGW